MDTFYKWAGGKSRMVKRYVELGLIPTAPHTVIEPFAGSGAVSLYLQPQLMFLNDVALPVYWFWRMVYEKPELIIDACTNLSDGWIKGKSVKWAYADCKAILNQSLVDLNDSSKSQLLSGLSLIASFLFCNKHGFNGLWRVNSQGQYNVPYGKYRTVNKWIPKLSDLWLIQPRLTASGVDFDEFLWDSSFYKKHKTFTFVDPPYFGTYSNYTQGSFSKSDHERLKKSIDMWGFGDIAVASVDCEEIRYLWRDWNIHLIPSKTTIQGQGSSVQNELLITNY